MADGSHMDSRGCIDGRRPGRGALHPRAAVHDFATGERRSEGPGDRHTRQSRSRLLRELEAIVRSRRRPAGSGRSCRDSTTRSHPASLIQSSGGTTARRLRRGERSCRGKRRRQLVQSPFWLVTCATTAAGCRRERACPMASSPVGSVQKLDPHSPRSRGGASSLAGRRSNAGRAVRQRSRSRALPYSQQVAVQSADSTWQMRTSRSGRVPGSAPSAGQPQVAASVTPISSDSTTGCSRTEASTAVSTAAEACEISLSSAAGRA